METRDMVRVASMMKLSNPCWPLAFSPRKCGGKYSFGFKSLFWHPSSPSRLISHCFRRGYDKKKEKAMYAICLMTAWYIWLHRNNKVFNAKNTSVNIWSKKSRPALFGGYQLRRSVQVQWICFVFYFCFCMACTYFVFALVLYDMCLFCFLLYILAQNIKINKVNMLYAWFH
ncbi:hypothetical protein Hdeb2414_s0007g00241711 [Helianthus debilis subsp. tardiflorus]